jgi:hypothetical protein
LKKAASGVLNALPSSRTGPYAPGVKPSAALPEGKHVLACMGWAGVTVSFFEHSLLPLRLDIVFQYLFDFEKIFNYSTGFFRFTENVFSPVSFAHF